MSHTDSGTELVGVYLTAALLLLPGYTLLAGEEARECAFARPGPHPVGVRTLVLEDSSRNDPLTGGKRTLVTEVWYPAADEARGERTTRFAEFFGEYREEGARVLKTDFEEIERRFRSLAVRDAPVRREGKYPLLIFSHGNGGFRHQNVFQMDHLASHGYLVASPDHTGNARLAPLPGGAVGYDRGGRQRSAEDRPKDVSFLIDRLLLEARTRESWLHARIDPERIGVLGHSFGGYTACRAAAEDRRIRAIVPMTVAMTGFTNPVPPASVPTLIFLGKHDRTVRTLGNATSRGYYLGCPAEKYLVTLERGGHFTFTEMAVLDPDFGDGIGRGKGLGGEEMDFLSVPMAKKIINAYTLAFLDGVLRGSARARKFLEKNHYPEEMVYLRAKGKAGGGAHAPHRPETRESVTESEP